MAITSDLRDQIRLVAESLRKKYYGGRGAPVSGEKMLSDLEDDSCELGDAIACELLSQILQDQAEVDHPDGSCPCTVCGKMGKRKKGARPRQVQGRRGDIAWHEPEYFCKSCRKSFFPSIERFGQ